MISFVHATCKMPPPPKKNKHQDREDSFRRFRNSVYSYLNPFYLISM
jgi:hypothetical protein